MFSFLKYFPFNIAVDSNVILAMFIFNCDFLILVQKVLIPQKYANGGWWGGG